MEERVRLEPDTTLCPVPIVLITCGAGAGANVFSLNRIASCNAEPPMLSISVRPARASHALIAQTGEFVVNIPWPEMELVSDFVGSTTARETDKWRETGFTALPAEHIAPPLLAECPVIIECRVQQSLRLGSHTLFVAQVLAVHALRCVVGDRGEVDFALARGGLPYRAGPVRERPVRDFRPERLLAQVREWRASRS